VLITGATDGRDRGRAARADPQAYDAGARRCLWELSERLTGVP
jgi:hypothetical protein